MTVSHNDNDEKNHNLVWSIWVVPVIIFVGILIILWFYGNKDIMKNII